MGDSSLRPIELVWFKRDLRVSDHAPLAQAARHGPCLCLYVYEPQLLAHPTTAATHLAFINGALVALAQTLAALGGALVTRVGELPEVFDRIHAQRPIARLWSHEETGLGVTFARDRRVRAWAQAQGVEWIELPNHGVFRPHPTRDGWAARWRARMQAPLTASPPQIIAVTDIASAGLPTPAQLGLAGPPQPGAAVPGCHAGSALLTAFLTDRGRTYQGDIGSPERAWTASSRLSPYLAWGNLSVRQVYQATQARLAALRADPHADPQWARSLASFNKRLHWHCHFIQRLEDQPDLEHRNLSPACDGLRPERPDTALLDAWAHGQTGYPLVDACMRALQATGWINFRMRAMLMSFAAYHLWQHWEAPALHLARLFQDFEPGIHFSQAQMQAGTTGINAVRIYSPVKQVRDQDPDGAFIRRWCPELAQVPLDYLPRPETMPLALQQACGCRIGRDYPAPLVDNGQAWFTARRRMQALRAGGAARTEARTIYARHGSRR
ncbi:MAG: deoxyribodipyrimidine photolyase, partial [Chromatiaceae bacterium]